VLAYAVKFMLEGSLKESFEAMAAALKERAEGST
jgi:hypothetical protein